MLVRQAHDPAKHLQRCTVGKSFSKKVMADA
jgi:hypothetical protein